MASSVPVLRRAIPNDARALVELVNLAGEGLPLYLWERMAPPGENPWSVGESRARREEGGFSYRNAVLLEVEGAVAACLIGYRLPDQPAPIDYDALPATFVPLQELENLASGTWYVNVLAAYPRFRRRGLGSRLLAAAEQYAAESGSVGLSLIVADTNHAARRLYERHGYRERARRNVIKNGWQHPSKEWVLLIKPLAAR